LGVLECGKQGLELDQKVWKIFWNFWALELEVFQKFNKEVGTRTKGFPKKQKTKQH
jgi:hypothetical protein